MDDLTPGGHSNAGGSGGNSGSGHGTGCDSSAWNGQTKGWSHVGDSNFQRQ